jgi:hypothetical protein
MSTGGHHNGVDRGRIEGGPRASLRCLRRGDWRTQQGPETAQQAVRAGRWGRKERERQITRRQNKQDAESAGSATVEKGRGRRGFYSCTVQSGEVTPYLRQSRLGSPPATILLKQLCGL